LRRERRFRSGGRARSSRPGATRCSARHVESRPPPVISCCSNPITTKLSAMRLGMNPWLARPSDPSSVRSSSTEVSTAAGPCIRSTTKATNQGPASRASTLGGWALWYLGREGVVELNFDRPRACNKPMLHTRRSRHRPARESTLQWRVGIPSDPLAFDRVRQRRQAPAHRSDEGHPSTMRS
jgi:hypothetical protein